MLQHNNPPRDGSAKAPAGQSTDRQQERFRESSSPRPPASSLSGRQQVPRFATSVVSAGVLLRTMLVNPRGLPGHDAEQAAEILHQTAPCVDVDPQSLKQRSHMLRRRAALVTASTARSLLPSCPVQKTQIVGSRHRQESLVAAANSLLVAVGTRPAGTLLQVHRCQMTTAAARRDFLIVHCRSC